ncbi:MAG: aconitate hydratase AcnA [Pirellulales bacterium]|nr:aconitate hydratase AcnA [Pirellulales bacterium]
MAQLSSSDPFLARGTLRTENHHWILYRLAALTDACVGDISILPYSIRILLESALRHCDGLVVTEEHVKQIATWGTKPSAPVEIPFKPARVVLQDFTGVPAVVDLAAMRSAMARMGGNTKKINPLVPCDLVIDHSVQVDHYASPDAFLFNVHREFERNKERYEFLRWGQQAFNNFRVIPPATGIVHQVNLECLARCVLTRDGMVFPDSLVGTDSHTTMINGLGVVGWGVGGIEAEGVMLGQPIYMLLPEVVGVQLIGELPEGATATDLVLMVTQRLREFGVVGKFVEYFGEGIDTLSLPDRATLANMAPEYGATMGFFPVDNETIAYLRRTGRNNDSIDLVDRYYKEQGMFRTANSPTPRFSATLEFDLGTVIPSLAGPKRPQDRIALADMKRSWHTAIAATLKNASQAVEAQSRSIEYNSQRFSLRHGAVVIAAITSCTNTSNPSVLIAAGLLAKKAIERNLMTKPWVKTSLAPGSRVVSAYLAKAGLQTYLDQLGFVLVGYGCTTCIGNSGPLPEPICQAIRANHLVVCSVLSGNRNFEGRIHPDVKANYLASPPLVVAYALAGTLDIDMATEPLGQDRDGKDVFLRDIWPSAQEINDTFAASITPEMFQKEYANVSDGPEAWQRMRASREDHYTWRADSTYIQEPPFFDDMPVEPPAIEPIQNARVLMLLGDSVTTDHISPAGPIALDSPAGQYLKEHGVEPSDFNSYGSRRGNDRVMTRGTFANPRIRNQLVPETEGGWTRHLPDGQIMTVYEAAMQYQAERVPLVILAGSEYGTGSSRDWAAKGTKLLGVRAILAASFERIHRSNLVGMGVLPLEFSDGQTWQSLGLTGKEIIHIPDLVQDLQPRQSILVLATSSDGKTKEFTTRVRIDTPVELDYYRNGGIMQTVLRKLLTPE